MIVKLLMGVSLLAVFVLAAIITIWWRSHYTYVYFGNSNAVTSWFGTFVGAFIISSIIIGIISTPLTWLDANCPYLLDVIVAGWAGYHFFSKSDDEGDGEGSPENIKQDGTENAEQANNNNNQ